MRSFIVNSDEKLRIDQFKDLEWRKETNLLLDIPLNSKLFKLSTVISNIRENGCYYIVQQEGMSIFGFLGNIGEAPHPVIELSYATSWYNSNLGGIYLIGLDEKTGDFFAPIE